MYSICILPYLLFSHNNVSHRSNAQPFFQAAAHFGTHLACHILCVHTVLRKDLNTSLIRFSSHDAAVVLSRQTNSNAQLPFLRNGRRSEPKKGLNFRATSQRPRGTDPPLVSACLCASAPRAETLVERAEYRGYLCHLGTD